MNEEQTQSTITCPKCGKGWMMVAIFFIVIAVASATMAFLYAAESKISDAERDELETLRAEVEEMVGEEEKEAEDLTVLEEVLSAWEFNPEKVEVGDVVGGMTLTEINSDRYLGPDEVDPERSWPLSASTFIFNDQIEITGSFELASPDDPFLAGSVCFSELDQESLEKIPYAITDSRSVWFCFNNQELANELFEGANGTATIVINEYSNVLIQSEVWNKATLVSVSEQLTSVE